MPKEKETFTIKQWDEADRPREKLIAHGIRTLSDAELIAILIGSGNRNESAVELAKQILKRCENNLAVLAKMSLQELQQFKGIGEAKAISIITGLELGRRTKAVDRPNRNKITCSKDVFELMHPLIGYLSFEEFWVLLLDNSNNIIHKFLLSQGGLTGTVVDQRILFKKALEYLATGIVICHNHPSGSLKPSTADTTITDKICLAAKSLDIKLIDHLIITEKAYFSFADENQL